MLHCGKDGGPESRVWMYGLEIKRLFTVALLRFEDGSREAYHSHAFNCVSWVIRGCLVERFKDWTRPTRVHGTGDVVVTRREDFHMVMSVGRTWVLTLRGPWSRTWQDSVAGRDITLTHGRVELP